MLQKELPKVNKENLCISVINGTCYPSNMCYNFCKDYETIDRDITQERRLAPRPMVNSKTLFFYNKSGNRVPIKVFAKERSTSRKRGSRIIPKAVQREVWRRDMGRCTECGKNENLEFDHIIPFSKGGSNTVRNIQLLCEKCNRSKGGNL